ncbi:hypothetical protein TIFTF001_026194 [Ficus carica]|uniref:Uncharacterized protein n=1 Tax=Ficus carica TaxID=3494 RepID=A0AA88IXW9_FICCA|nr:hypothetical protein TIFTF001_026194 [Ficus carica]
MVPPKEDHVLRLKKLLEQDDAIRKLKWKQKEQGSTSQMMVQKPIPQNPLTKMIQDHCTRQLPQISLQMSSISSEEESAPEDSKWSSDVSEPEDPISPQPIMMNQPADEPTVTEIFRNSTRLVDETRRIQTAYVPSDTVEGALSQLYAEFCGEENQIIEQARSEYFKIKCCSIHKKDLEVHFQKMSRRFYLIGGLNDPNLKQAFLSLIPDPLGEETFRLLFTANKKIAETTFGELCQLIMKVIDKMCSQNKFLQEHIKQTNNIDKVCTNKELYTKCPSNPTP